jgi:hypothetical protein
LARSPTALVVRREQAALSQWVQAPPGKCSTYCVAFAPNLVQIQLP